MHLKVHLIHGPNFIFIIYNSFEKRLFLMNARAYQREEAEMILSKSRDINVVFTLFNSVHYFTYLLRNDSTVFSYATNSSFNDVDFYYTKNRWKKSTDLNYMSLFARHSSILMHISNRFMFKHSTHDFQIKHGA